MPEAAHPLPGPVPSHLFSGRLPPGPVVMAGFGSVGSMRAICRGRTCASGEHLPRENHGRELFDSLGVARGSQKVSSLLFRSCFAVVSHAASLAKSTMLRCGSALPVQSR